MARRGEESPTSPREYRTRGATPMMKRTIAAAVMVTAFALSGCWDSERRHHSRGRQVQGSARSLALAGRVGACRDAGKALCADSDGSLAQAPRHASGEERAQESTDRTRGGGNLMAGVRKRPTGERASRYRRVAVWTLLGILLGALVAPLGGYVYVGIASVERAGRGRCATRARTTGAQCAPDSRVTPR